MFCNGFLKCFQVFLQVFQTHVSNVSSIFQPYDANVSSGCFKSRSDVTHDAMGAPATATYCSYVRSGGDSSGPRAWSGDAGPAWEGENASVRRRHAGARTECRRALEMECRHRRPDV